ncbi:hypothetical protein EVAR_92231_1 [Eumeta japonica]|uniref:Uncharacterized protein n=1 Tax=Eumeta variegata TaxID=151549 RepID=A0A4C1TNI1_EUMVA|nr:hypothetical protein EVAR_92231_1 [Eumeta japonica]
MLKRRNRVYLLVRRSDIVERRIGGLWALRAAVAVHGAREHAHAFPVVELERLARESRPTHLEVTKVQSVSAPPMGRFARPTRMPRASRPP